MQGEDIRVIETANQMSSISAHLEEFDDVIQIQVSLLQALGYNPVILYGHELHRYFFESKNYEPRWRTTKLGPKGLRNIDGFYKEIVVMRAPLSPKSVAIFDPAKFGTLAYYRIDDDKPDFPILFSVKEISIQRAKEYIVKNPNLSKHPETGIMLSEEDALKRIQQDVELDILMRFRVEDIDSKAGIIINFGNSDNSKGSADEEIQSARD